MTLGEVMIVTVVMGLLAAVAIPNYQRAMELGYRREAQDLLMTLYHGERSFFFGNQDYRALAPSSSQTEWRQIFLDNPNLSTIPVDFSITTTAGPPPTFTATATRRGSTSSISINENREWCGADVDPNNAACMASWPIP